MLDQDFQVKEVQENGGGADENVRQVGRVDLAEIARKEAILSRDTVNMFLGFCFLFLSFFSLYQRGGEKEKKKRKIRAEKRSI